MDLYATSRIAVGAILALTSLGKWLNLTWFARVVVEYHVVPTAAARAVAVLITSSETMLALLLLTGRGQPASEIAAAALIAVVTVAVVRNLLRGRTDLECGCTGRPGQKIGWNVVGRNLGLVGLALLSANVISTNLSAIDIAPLVFVGCVGLFLWPTALQGLQGRRPTQNHALDAVP